MSIEQIDTRSRNNAWVRASDTRGTEREHRGAPQNVEIQKSDFRDETDRQILGAIEGIRFGSVEIIIIHEGKVVQIERTEKVRLNP